MESLASLQAVHDFLNLHCHHRRHHQNQKDTNSMQHRFHRGSRSASLSDRRGLINAPRLSTRKSSISPSPHHKRHDVDSVDTLAMLMHIMENDGSSDPIRGMLLPARALNNPINKPLVWEHMRRTLPNQADSVSKDYVGEVLLTLRYNIENSRLNVDVIQARDISGRQNCGIFLSAQLLQRCKILEKHETSSKPLAPKIPFKETLEFTVPFALLYYNDANLLVKVCQDTKNAEEIGHFVVGPQGNISGAQHWKQIFSTPNISFSAWHKLTPAIRYPKTLIKHK